MRSTYLEHLSKINNNLKKEGIDLGLDFSENCTHLSEQVTVLEQYLYYNHILRTTNSNKQLVNILPFEESSLDDFLRKKLYEEYEDKWNAKLEELTKQPDDAGVLDSERKVIDRGAVRAFHEFLNLKTEDEKPSVIPSWSAFTNSGVSDEFDDEDEEDEDDLFYPDDEDDDDFSEVSQNPQSVNKLSDGRNSALSSILPANSSSDMEFDDEDDEYPDFEEDDEYEFDDDEESSPVEDDDYPEFDDDDEYEFEDEEDDDDYPDFDDEEEEFDEDDDYPDFDDEEDEFDDEEEEFDEDDDYPDFEDDEEEFEDDDDDYPDFDDEDDYPDFEDEEDDFDDDYPDFEDEEDDYPDFEEDDDDYPDFEDDDDDYPDFEDEEDDDYPDFDNYDEDDSDDEPDFDDYDEDDYEDEYSDLNVQSIQPVQSSSNTGVSNQVQPPKQRTPAKETVMADKTIDSVNKLLNKLFR